MARQVRIQFEGAVYHVMARGDRRESIIGGDKDRRMFIETFGVALGFRAVSRVSPEEGRRGGNSA